MDFCRRAREKQASFTIAFLSLAVVLLGTCGIDAISAAPRSADTLKPDSRPQTDMRKAQEVRVTYIGNAGFLVAVGNKKILVDALFNGYPYNYKLPREIQAKLTQGLPPFDGVDLVLATHIHADHFDENLVRLFLKSHPAAVFASTPQATALLAEFGDRVIAFAPARNKPERKDIQGIHVEAIYLSHGATPAGKTEILNFGYLVSAAGVAFFHSGDVDASQFGFADFLALGIAEKKIDLAFIPHFNLTDDPAEQKFVKEGIAARYIIPMHYHYSVPPMSPDAIVRNYPAAILFTAELQSWVMPKSPSLAGPRSSP
jgi:L-ascorbate metabolism protein UlaG (beta-lactamase superfamily)